MAPWYQSAKSLGTPITMDDWSLPKIPGRSLGQARFLPSSSDELGISMLKPIPPPLRQLPAPSSSCPTLLRWIRFNMVCLLVCASTVIVSSMSTGRSLLPLPHFFRFTSDVAIFLTQLLDPCTPSPWSYRLKKRLLAHIPCLPPLRVVPMIVKITFMFQIWNVMEDLG